MQSDTKLCPDSGMSAGSRSHYMNGHATRVAGEKLMAAMRKADGTYRTHAEMVAEHIPVKVTGRYETAVTPGLSRLDPNTGIGNPSPAYTYALNLAEVEVDASTGKTRVINHVALFDLRVERIAHQLHQCFGLLRRIVYPINQRPFKAHAPIGLHDVVVHGMCHVAQGEAFVDWHELIAQIIGGGV